MVAQQLINEFDIRRKEFVKVFPYEYQRALKQKAVPEAAVVQNHQAEPKILDIEDTIGDQTQEQKKLERVLDKTRGW